MVKAVVTWGSFTKVDRKSVNVMWGRFPEVNFHGKVTEHSRKCSNQNTVWIENRSVCLGKPTNDKTSLDNLRILFIRIFSLFLCLLFFYFSIVTFYEEAA